MAGISNEVLYGKNADFTSVNNQSVQESNGLATNGQMWIGTTSVNAGGTHVNVGSLTSPDSSITIGYSSPNITLQVAGGLFTWSSITASQALLVNRGYFCVSPGGALSLSIPATSSEGNIIEIALDGATSFTITQGAGQSIKLGNLTTTAGVGGSLASTQQGDWVRLVCRVANLTWVVLGVEGNLTVV